MAIHIGHQRAGWPGLLVAGACFIVPAALITTAFAWAYTRYGTLAQAEHLLYGVKPVIIAVVAQAICGLARSAVRTLLLGIVATGGVVASFLGVNELVVLFVSGAFVAVAHGARLLPTRPPTAVSWHLGRAAVIDLTTAALAIGSAVLLLRFRLNSAWLVLGGGLLGLAGAPAC
jgi:chromate transporter